MTTVRAQVLAIQGEILEIAYLISGSHSLVNCSDMWLSIGDKRLGYYRHQTFSDARFVKLPRAGYRGEREARGRARSDSLTGPASNTRVSAYTKRRAGATQEHLRPSSWAI